MENRGRERTVPHIPIIKKNRKDISKMRNIQKNRLVEIYLEEYNKGNIDEKEAIETIIKIIRKE